jgi:dihydrofolate synthase/folylpolyglutamate synthase
MEIDPAYQQALDYLYGFVDYSLTRAFRNAPEHFDLGRMVDFLARLGNPHQKYACVHVAGTKGKGSTSAMIVSVLQAAGYRTGFYSSPHLLDYTERIRMDGQPITHERLVEMIDRIKPVVADVPGLTTFEITTALGLLYFAEEGADVGVLEVGLGGRLDATNVVNPLVSVITSISYDHTQVLGDTLALIAGEKGGIIKPGRPVVVAPQREEARRVLEHLAMERQAPLTQVGVDFLYAAGSHSTTSQTFLIWSSAEQMLATEFIETAGRENWQPLRITIPLLGYHQIENAATAYAALQVIGQNGLPVSEADILRGLAGVHWPGRFEYLRRKPPVIVDSAHNPDSALKLRQALDDYLPGQPIILVFGASEDKDIHGMMDELLPRVRRVIATESVHPRAIKADTLVELTHRHGKPAQAILPVEAALVKALELAGSEAAVVITGSIFIAAAAQEAWQQLGLAGMNGNGKEDNPAAGAAFSSTKRGSL